jgi:hypothetical protein
MQPIGSADSVKNVLHRTEKIAMNSPQLAPANRLPARLAKLLSSELPPLGPGEPQAAFAAGLESADPAVWCGSGSPDSPAAACCAAGLWLWNGFLDRSHEISQEIDTAEGSWWHGIMHRREPDPGNAAYWFRRVGRHPLFGSLADAMQQLAAGRSLPAAASWLATVDRWDPFRFIDFCETARCSGDSSLQAFAQEAAAVEWYELFHHCQQQAADS